MTSFISLIKNINSEFRTNYIVIGLRITSKNAHHATLDDARIFFAFFRIIIRSLIKLITSKPGVFAVLHCLLPIFPPPISIIKNIVCTSSLESKSWPGCLFHSSTFLLILFFLSSIFSYHRSTVHERPILAEPGLAREKANPINIWKALRLNYRRVQWGG